MGLHPAVKPFERIGFETLGTTSQVFKVFNNKGLSEITGTYENPRLFVEKFLSFFALFTLILKSQSLKKDFISFKRVNSFSYDLKSVGEKFQAEMTLRQLIGIKIFLNGEYSTILSTNQNVFV